MNPAFPPPPLADYFPPTAGRYAVVPGHGRFGQGLGNGPADARVFQIDAAFPTYRAAKLEARRTRAIVCPTETLDERIAARVVRFVVGRMAGEHPAIFTRTDEPPGISAALTGEALAIDAAGRLAGVAGPAPADPPYADALDALAAQVQEDLAVLALGPDGGDRLAAARVCFPSGWAPERMVGRDFAGLHAAVPGMAAMNRHGPDFARLMAEATDGLVRFAWGLAFDDQLDHHPDRPTTPFDPARPAAWLRVERQTIWGFPDVGAALFTIRTYLYPCATVCHDAARRDRLVSAVASMSPESLAYKGLAACRDPLLRWLTSLR